MPDSVSTSENLDTKHGTDIPVRFEVGGKVLDLSSVNRMARRLLDIQVKKQRKAYAAVVGEQGERPTIVIRSARILDPRVEIRLEYPEAMKDQVKGHEKAERVS